MLKVILDHVGSYFLHRDDFGIPGHGYIDVVAFAMGAAVAGTGDLRGARPASVLCGGACPMFRSHRRAG